MSLILASRRKKSKIKDAIYQNATQKGLQTDSKHNGVDLSIKKKKKINKRCYLPICHLKGLQTDSIAKSNLLQAPKIVNKIEAFEREAAYA